MNITFKNNKLRKLAENENRCYKELGQIRGTIFLRRLSNIHSAACLDDLKPLPGRFHELVGDRKGQWACDLDNPYRLVFTPLNTDDEIEVIVEIIEIVNYHGK